MPPKARYALQDVFRLLGEGKYWFSAESRSIVPVMELYERLGTPKSPKQAREFIIAGLRTLTDMDFCESVLQCGDPKCVADVYGIIFDGQPWFVKFRIDEDQVVEEISFHPPEKDLRTVAGKVISGGGSKNDGKTERR